MASGPITSWEIDGETVETISDFILGGSKITADGDCSHEIKRRLLLGRKVMTNLDSILKSRDITLSTKVHLVKAMVFPVVMYGCESWTVKKAERQRIDAFELCCWRRLLRVPWTAKKSNQSILKESSPGCLLEGMMLRLKVQYFGSQCKDLTHWKRLWCWEGLRAGREGDDKGWGGWMASLTQWRWVWVNSGSWWWTGRPGLLRFMGLQKVGHDWATELNWTELDYKIKLVNPKGNQPWIFTGRTDAANETPVFWPPDMNSWLIEKDPDAGKDWRQKRKRAAEDEMVGWHHQLNGCEFEQTPDSRRWWRTGKPGVLQSMGSQSVSHDWVIE